MIYFFFVDDAIIEKPNIFNCVLHDCKGCSETCQDIYILKKQYEKDINEINKNYLNKSMKEWLYSLEQESYIRINKEKFMLNDYLRMRLITVGAIPCFKFIDIYSCKNIHILDFGHEYFNFINHCVLTIIIINDIVSIAKEKTEKDEINIFVCLEYSNLSWKEKFDKSLELLLYNYKKAQKLSKKLKMNSNCDLSKCIDNYLKLITNNIEWHMIADRYIDHKFFWKQYF